MNENPIKMTVSAATPRPKNEAKIRCVTLYVAMPHAPTTIDTAEVMIRKLVTIVRNSAAGGNF